MEMFSATCSCIAVGLVGGEGFAVDASLIAADANKQRSITGQDWRKDRDPARSSRAVKEYLATLDDTEWGAASDVVEAGITLTLPKPQTSGAKSDGRFGKQDFVYLPEEDAYRCPAGEQLPYRSTNEEDGSGYDATGPQPVKIARLNSSARQARAADSTMGA